MNLNPTPAQLEQIRHDESALDLATRCLKKRSQEFRQFEEAGSLPELQDALVAVNGAIAALSHRKFSVRHQQAAQELLAQLHSLADSLLDTVVALKP